MTDPFYNAKFYDCRDSEQLTCTDPGEAILEYFDACWDVDLTLEQNLEGICPITVTAYNPKKISEQHLKWASERAFESFLEYLDEDYGDPEDQNSLLSTPAKEEVAWAIIGAASAEIASLIHVWSCEKVGTCQYDIDEVRKLAKHYGF